MKVEVWLAKQQGPETTQLRGTGQSIQFMNSWTLNHIQSRPNNVTAGNSFTVSESGAIGISCSENPSLSIIYPDTDKPPVVLPDSKFYRSATFVRIYDEEYLAAASKKNGHLYLWNIESKALNKVFDPKLPSKQHYNYMIMCKINENMIGYGEVCASSDGSRRIFILKMDTKEEWTLSGTLQLFTPGDMWEMCYTNIVDTPCLLLCVPYNHRIMAVEMIGGKTRWEVGKQQMGEKFYPWSICTDENNIVYVADYNLNMIHLLSAEDGSVIGSIDTRHYGVLNLITIRFHDGHLYVEHYKNSDYKYAISKFKSCL